MKILQPSGPGWQQRQEEEFSDWETLRGQGPHRKQALRGPSSPSPQHAGQGARHLFPTCSLPTHGARVRLGAGDREAPAQERGAPIPEGSGLGGARPGRTFPLLLLLLRLLGRLLLLGGRWGLLGDQGGRLRERGSDQAVGCWVGRCGGRTES